MGYLFLSKLFELVTFLLDKGSLAHWREAFGALGTVHRLAVLLGVHYEVTFLKKVRR